MGSVFFFLQNCNDVLFSAPQRVWYCLPGNQLEEVNTLRPRLNGRHFADDIIQRIFLNDNIWIPIKISLKFVPKGSINNIPALVQIMGWRRPGDKPLSEPMMVNLPTHICVTRPQWVNLMWLRDILQWHKSGMAELMACCRMAPSHYLNQFFSLVGFCNIYMRPNFARIAHELNP